MNEGLGREHAPRADLAEFFSEQIRPDQVLFVISQLEMTEHFR